MLNGQFEVVALDENPAFPSFFGEENEENDDGGGGSSSHNNGTDNRIFIRLWLLAVV